MRPKLSQRPTFVAYRKRARDLADQLIAAHVALQGGSGSASLPMAGGPRLSKLEGTVEAAQFMARMNAYSIIPFLRGEKLKQYEKTGFPLWDDTFCQLCVLARHELLFGELKSFEEFAVLMIDLFGDEVAPVLPSVFYALIHRCWAREVGQDILDSASDYLGDSDAGVRVLDALKAAERD